MWNPVDITALVVAVAAGAVAVINALRARTAAASAMASAKRAAAAASRLEPGPFGGPSVIGDDGVAHFDPPSSSGLSSAAAPAWSSR